MHNNFRFISLIAFILSLMLVGCSDVDKNRASSISDVKIVFLFGGFSYERNNIPIDKKSVDYKLKLSYFDGSSEISTAPVVWKSSQKSVATINANGMATLITTGETWIHADVTIDDVLFSAQTLLNVVDNPVESIHITSVPPNTVAKGNSKTYIATAKISGFDLPIPVVAEWSTNADGFVDIKKEGISAIAETNATSNLGEVYITAVYRTVPNTVMLEVTPAELVDITITSDLNTTVGVGQKITFEANGMFTDNHSELVTDDVKWKSSDNTILKFETILGKNTNIAKGISTGDVNVTATKTYIQPLKPNITKSVKVEVQ